VLVTGGAGFIGSAVVRHLINHSSHRVVVVDKLTYAGNLQSLGSALQDPRCRFEQMDICSLASMRQAFAMYRPEVVFHLAAESHVDRSIDGPAEFIRTNVEGTYSLLQAALEYWDSAKSQGRAQFRFVHVSTDEVFGSLGPAGRFTETTPYSPRSPYSATKAASDHLVRAWFHTYGLPIVVTNCSNNYGPYQFPEKLIPLVILKCLAGESVPVYGRGENVRDWLFVDDHVRALAAAWQRGRIGETYNIGGQSERTNLQVVQAICALLNELAPRPIPYETLITFVPDRPGHDLRYAMETTKAARELDWSPRESFDSGLRLTVRWYLENRQWWQDIISGKYSLERLGINRPALREE